MRREGEEMGGEKGGRRERMISERGEMAREPFFNG